MKNRFMKLKARCTRLRRGIAAAEIRPPRSTRRQHLFVFEKYQNRGIKKPPSPILLQNRKQRPHFSGGDEGNRTPVQKACPTSLSERSS